MKGRVLPVPSVQIVELQGFRLSIGKHRLPTPAPCPPPGQACFLLPAGPLHTELWDASAITCTFFTSLYIPASSMRAVIENGLQLSSVEKNRVLQTVLKAEAIVI